MSDQEQYMDVYELTKGATRAFEENAARLEGPDPGVHFACRLLGPYNYLTIVTVAFGDVSAAREIISSLYEEGESGPYGSTTAVAYEFLQTADGVLRPKRGVESVDEPVRPKPPPECKRHEMFAPIHVTPGMLRDVFTRLGEVPRLMGCALVDGAFDIFIEVGAETYLELRESIDSARDIVGRDGRVVPCFVTWR
jgi:hypothetical protein